MNLKQVVKTLGFAASVTLSTKYADGYWVVGSVFGLVVLLWDSENWKSFLSVKRSIFLGFSIGIYALVYFISRRNWDFGEFVNFFIGPFQVAILFGSVAMPLTHRFLLSGSGALKVSTLLITAFYIITFISFLNDYLRLNFHVNFLFIYVALWQGIYLKIFYNEEKK